MPGRISTKTPKSAIRTILTLSRSPIFWRVKKSSQMSPSSCLMPSETFCFSTSMLRMTASASSPTLSLAEGCLIFSQEMSEMWMRPSMPGSTSRKAPKSVIDVILPLTRVPGGVFCLKSSSGWGWVCLRPREMRLEVGLTSRMETVDLVARG